MKAVIWLGGIGLALLLAWLICDAIDAATVTHGQVVARDYTPAWVETHYATDNEGHSYTYPEYHPDLWTITILGTNSKCQWRTRVLEVSQSDYVKYDINVEWPQLESKP